jgi:hypothetical protein
MNQNGDQKKLMDYFEKIMELYKRVGKRLIIKGSVVCLPQAGSSPSGPTKKSPAFAGLF